MGLLSDEYYQNLLKQNQPAPSPEPTPTPAATTTVQTPPKIGGGIFNNVPNIIGPQKARGTITPGVAAENVLPEAPFKTQPDISEERQIGRFGAPVGSQEYYEQKSKTPLRSFLPQQIMGSFGLQFPDMETWDKMSRFDQASHIGFMGVTAAARMIRDLPREVVKAPIRYGVSVYQPWKAFREGKVTGQGGDAVRSAAEEKELRLPWLGAIPSYWKSFKDATDSGIGPGAASLMVGSTALGDITVGASMAEGIAAGLRPRKAIVEGQVIQDTKPIQTAIVAEGEKLRTIRKTPSSAEYYSLPETVAKKNGGNSRNTFLKITPAGDGASEISIVQVRQGIVPRGVDYVKEKFGAANKTYQGDFGREIKVQSQLIPTSRGTANITEERFFNAIAKGESEGTGGYGAIGKANAEGQKAYGKWQVMDFNIPAWTKQYYGKELTPEQFLKNVKAQDAVAKGELGRLVREHGVEDGASIWFSGMKLKDAIAKGVKDANGMDAAGYVAKVKKNLGIIQSEEVSGIIKSIPPKPLKGFEDMPVTMEQITNIERVSSVNGLEPGIRDSVIRTITGKKVMGEMTQTEYGNVVKTLASLNNAGKYVPEAKATNIFAQYGSPQRNWMRKYEEKTGIPLYSEVYVPMEESIRLRNVFRENYRAQAREVFGDYAKVGFGEERRLIKNYMEGDQGAILSNPKLTPKVKEDLIKIADQLAPLYDQLGDIFGIPREVFLKDYQPHIADLGGVYQLYKEGTPIPKELTFFADFKRHGSLNVQVDDALAIFDIYTNAGSNKMFLNPALERVGRLSESVPGTIHSSIKSYVQEKLGYAGKLEEFLDKLGNNINEKMGWNLPPDVARQMTQLAMDTMYSGALANPGSVFRNSLQYDLLAYPRLGPRFYADAARKALTKEGMAEVRDAGFLVELGVPYGEELAKDITLAGKAGNLYHKGTQATLAPFSVADNIGRARAYWQTKFQFNDAVARYNSGKITWEKLEKELDFGALSPVDRNIIRQRLKSGDTKGAFENLVREVIDETQFPYRRGSSARATYGLGGKLSTTFLQWPIEFGHTMGRWLRTGQLDKWIRYYASSTAISRSFEDVLGLDFRKSVAFGPFQIGLSPAVKTAQDLYEMTKAFTDDNAEELEKNKEELVRTMKTLGVPAGVQIDKWRGFQKSIAAHDDPANPKVGPNGEYPVLDSRGRVKYYTTFKDLWWTMWGFPTEERLRDARLQTEMRNEKFDYTRAKQHVLELYQKADGDDPNDPNLAEANRLVEEYQIGLTPQDFDQYYIPMNQRTYESLPASLKAKFAPRVFPAPVNQ